MTDTNPITYSTHCYTVASNQVTICTMNVTIQPPEPAPPVIPDSDFYAALVIFTIFTAAYGIWIHYKMKRLLKRRGMVD